MTNCKDCEHYQDKSDEFKREEFCKALQWKLENSDICKKFKYTDKKKKEIIKEYDSAETFHGNDYSGFYCDGKGKTEKGRVLYKYSISRMTISNWKKYFTKHPGK